MEGYMIGIGTLVFTLVTIWFFRQRQLGAEWSGTVIDKNSSMVGVVNSGVGVLNNAMTLKVKKDDGETTSINVSDGVYEQFKVGDKIKKRKGQSQPVK